MMSVSEILIGAIIALASVLYLRRKRQHELFKRLGVPGPQPHWWHGNLRELHGKSTTVHMKLQDWTKTYGKVFGYYEGPTPVLVVSDMDVLQQILVTNFSNFHSKKISQIQINPDTTRKLSLAQAHGSNWKRLRSICNPTFSSAKLKQTMPLVHEKVGIMLQKCSEASESGKPINIQSFFAALTMDVIGESAFGMRFDTLTNPKAKIPAACLDVVASLSRRSFAADVASRLPEISSLISYIFVIVMKMVELPARLILDSVGEVIEMRRKKPELRRTDLMQLLMDAETSGTTLKNAASSIKKNVLDTVGGDNYSSSSEISFSSSTFRKEKLTDMEIKAQGLTFLLAGYETTSTMLSYCTYLLAINPDKQDKLFQEIREHFSHDEIPTYDTINSLQYLDMVLCETLRLYPIGGLVVSRVCMGTCVVGNLTIPTGVAVQADSWSVHYDRDAWGPIDPEIFEPERFLPELKAKRHPLAWIPFGAGPRICIGLRFAMMEAKIAIARLVSTFRIEKCAETEIPLQVVERVAVCPKNGVLVQLIKRR